VNKKLPSRPDLDHLRRQAKSLLASLERGEADAIATFREHLPAAKDLSDARIRGAGFRLADAQSAVARKTGFASWPRLSRHVEQLRALEGTWEFERLQVDGVEMPAAGLVHSHLLIDGDRFRTESPEATYEGVFNIDVEVEPHAIDIEFVAGPEAGNCNHGIFRFANDRLDLCLEMSGKARPREFRTSPGSGCAFETLRRSSRSRPPAVTGGTTAEAKGNATPEAPVDAAAFPHVPSALLTRLQGDWNAEQVVRDGQELPKAMLAMGRRTAKGNEIEIAFGGQVVIHALVRFDESKSPVAVDYLMLGGPTRGTLQLGIMEWRNGNACFCMAPPGQPRPDDFTSPAGSGRTSSVWKPKKK
jgi:uncharacterized protein (TIGR03067 family)